MILMIKKACGRNFGLTCMKGAQIELKKINHGFVWAGALDGMNS